MLTPDTAHGTNPATVTMAGYEVVKVGTDEHGGVDIDDLRAKADDDVACLMLTNPNTLGLFDRNIEEIASIVHGVGGHALLRRGQPERGDGHLAARRHGLRHRPLQPAQDLHPAARRRRPGRRADRRARTGSSRSCPRPQVVRRERRATAPARASTLDHDRPKSIGKMRGFQGNFGVFVRSYAYICSLGADGLREASETGGAERQLPAGRGWPRRTSREYLPIAFDRLCMHEFVLSGTGAKDKLGIKTLDIAKRMLDHEVHPPTVYFPLLVDEALMIEPTETEPKERLDHFAEVVRAILEEAREDPEIARNAPYTTPVRRLDEAGAAKQPVVRWSADAENPGDPDARGRGLGRRRRRPVAPHIDCAAVRIFSGIQPTGRKHLGNYIGAIRGYVEGQERGDPAIYCIVDLHATTVAYDPADAAPLRVRHHGDAHGLRARPRALHPVPPGRRARAHRAVLAASARSPPTATSTGCTSSRTSRPSSASWCRPGLFLYPVLQAADVLAYRADEVPVGDDQRQHVELMRDIAERFNATYGEVLVPPEHVIPEVGARIMDLQDPTREDVHDRQRGARPDLPRRRGERDRQEGQAAR